MSCTGFTDVTAGLQVWGSHGLIQIDEDYHTLSLVSKGHLVGSGAITLTNGVSPVCAIIPDFGPEEQIATVQSVTTSGTTWFWNIMGNCYYWIFDVIPSSSPNNVGLQVFKSDGSLAFDSSYAPMRVVGVFDHTPDNREAATALQIGTLAGMGGRSIAFAQSRPAFYLENRPLGVGSPRLGVGLEGVYVQGAPAGASLGVYSMKRDIALEPTSTGPTQHQSGQHIAIDVTGL